MPILWIKPFLSLLTLVGCVCSEQRLVVSPLSVSIEPCGKKRLILDLRHVNKSLIKQSVRQKQRWW